MPGKSTSAEEMELSSRNALGGQLHVGFFASVGDVTLGVVPVLVQRGERADYGAFDGIATWQGPTGSY